jgi:hypothetical protein
VHGRTEFASCRLKTQRAEEHFNTLKTEIAGAAARAAARVRRVWNLSENVLHRLTLPFRIVENRLDGIRRCDLRT